MSSNNCINSRDLADDWPWMKKMNDSKAATFDSIATPTRSTSLLQLLRASFPTLVNDRIDKVFLIFASIHAFFISMTNMNWNCLRWYTYKKMQDILILIMSMIVFEMSFYCSRTFFFDCRRRAFIRKSVFFEEGFDGRYQNLLNRAGLFTIQHLKTNRINQFLKQISPMVKCNSSTAHAS